MLFASHKLSKSKSAPAAQVRPLSYNSFNYYAASSFAATATARAQRGSDTSLTSAKTTVLRRLRKVAKISSLLAVLVVISLIGLHFTPSSSAQSVPGSAYSIGNSDTATVVNSSPPLIVNKQRQLQPQNYTPMSLVVPPVPLRLDGNSEEMHVSSIIANPLAKLFTDAQATGLQLRLSSGYRSYETQTRLYSYYVSTQGQQVADEQSARPGYSEHQTGLAVDVSPVSGNCDAQQCFAQTPEGVWIASYGYRYGFIIRYPEGKSAVTGYEHEPWHLRYVGIDLATKLHNSNVTTLEEYFHLPSAPNYN